MPNTLAHLGINGFITRTLIREADLKWIYVGCIIPDFPWILQRILVLVYSDIDAYDLRLYCITQSSLLLCLILGLALATLSAQFLRTFVILGLGAFLHLLLDAFQIKWANGVHLFAPISWELMRLDFFWPENTQTYLISVFGLIYFLVYWRQAVSSSLDISLDSISRKVLFTFFLAFYFILPFIFINKVYEADNHFVKTLENIRERPGRYVEIDRPLYLPQSSGGILRAFTKEEFKVACVELDHPATISIRGTFISEDTICIHEYHEHSSALRDIFSYTGLSLVTIVWIVALVRQKKRVLSS